MRCATHRFPLLLGQATKEPKANKSSPFLHLILVAAARQRHFSDTNPAIRAPWVPPPAARALQRVTQSRHWWIWSAREHRGCFCSKAGSAVPKTFNKHAPSTSVLLLHLQAEALWFFPSMRGATSSQNSRSKTDNHSSECLIHVTEISVIVHSGKRDMSLGKKRRLENLVKVMLSLILVKSVNSCSFFYLQISFFQPHYSFIDWRQGRPRAGLPQSCWTWLLIPASDSDEHLSQNLPSFAHSHSHIVSSFVYNLFFFVISSL